MKKFVLLSLFVAAIAFMAVNVQADSLLFNGFATTADLPVPQTGVTSWLEPDIGVTEGAYSCGIIPKAPDAYPTYWTDAGMFYIPTDQLVANTRLEFDYTVPSGSGECSDWTGDFQMWMQGGDPYQGYWGLDSVAHTGGHYDANISMEYLVNDLGEVLDKYHVVMDYTGKVPATWGWNQSGIIGKLGETRALYYDNMRLTTIPEPSTITLLVMSGLAALLYWRKR